MKLLGNILTLIVGLLFEGGALFALLFLTLLIISWISGKWGIFFFPFLGLFGILIISNLIFNKDIYK